MSSPSPKAHDSSACSQQTGEKRGLHVGGFYGASGRITSANPREEMYFHVQVVLAYRWKQQLEPAAKPAHYEVCGRCVVREAELSLGPLPEIKGMKQWVRSRDSET